MKGILLAGGKGSRLYPVTKGLSKGLLPVYNKPMIYYSMSTLMLAGIRDILIITNPEFIELYRSFFGDGSDLGISVTYKPQSEPKGIAEAFIIGEEFIGADDVCLMLSDNLFYGHDLHMVLQRGRKKIQQTRGAVVFGYNVSNPEDYGVIELDKDQKVVSIEEKPQDPKSNIAVVGLYMYDNSVISVSKKIKPSDRGELEITTVNQEYLRNKSLKFELFGRGYAWFDTGNCDSLFKASAFIQTIEKRQGLKVACLEEIACYMGYTTKQQMLDLTTDMGDSEYTKYVKELAHEENA